MMDKKLIRRLKNRDSAVRSRQKKDELIDRLRSQFEMYNGEIRQLTEANYVLRKYLPQLYERDLPMKTFESKKSQLILEPAVFLL